MIYYIQMQVPLPCKPIKIGYTRTLGTRFDALKCACPYPLRILAVQVGGQAEEARIHQKYKYLRISGEWFKPAPELLTHISLQDTETPALHPTPTAYRPFPSVDKWDKRTVPCRDRRGLNERGRPIKSMITVKQTKRRCFSGWRENAP